MCWRFTCVSVCTNPRVPERDRSCTSRCFVYLSSCLFLSRPLLFPPTGMYLEDLGATVSLVEGAQQWLGGSCPFLRPHPCSLLLDSHASTRVVAPPTPRHSPWLNSGPLLNTWDLYLHLLVYIYIFKLPDANIWLTFPPSAGRQFCVSLV